VTVTTIPHIWDTRLTNWRKILQKYQNAGGNTANNINGREGLRRLHVKVLKAINASQSNPYNVHTVRRLEALMIRGVLKQ
jgi:hypothetical protein